MNGLLMKWWQVLVILRKRYSEKQRAFFCDLIEHDGSAIGFALWFYNFSTFLGRHGIYLEDLYVRPEVRGLGAGKALLAHLAQKCIDENLGRLEWAVLDWNEPAITFYERIGSEARNGWTTRRLAGQALAALAAPEVVA